MVSWMYITLCRVRIPVHVLCGYRIHSNYSAKKIDLGHGLALKLECENYTYVSGGAY